MTLNDTVNYFKNKLYYVIDKQLFELLVQLNYYTITIVLIVQFCSWFVLPFNSSKLCEIMFHVAIQLVLVHIHYILNCTDTC